jgi:hypothetical protein
MANLPHHTDLLCELVTSLLMKGIQMGGMLRLGSLTGLLKHATWTDFLYFLYPLLLSIPKILASYQPTP